MNYAIHRISLDVTDDSPSQLTISAKQGDTAKVLIISLLDDKKNYQIAQGSVAVFIAKKSNGVWLEHPCMIDFSANKVIYTFQEDTVSSSGTIECEIHLSKATVVQNEDGKTDVTYEDLTTATFVIAVHDTILSGLTDSTEESVLLPDLITRGTSLFTTLEQATIPNAEAATANANTATANAEAATSNAQTATDEANTATANAEVATSNAEVATSNAEVATANAEVATERAITAATNTEEAIAQANALVEEVEGKLENGDFNGVSVTHSWSGTTLNITSASGTSSADLKGLKGDKGDRGLQGEKGDSAGIVSVKMSDTDGVFVFEGKPIFGVLTELDSSILNRKYKIYCKDSTSKIEFGISVKSSALLATPFDIEIPLNNSEHRDYCYFEFLDVTMEGFIPEGSGYYSSITITVHYELNGEIKEKSTGGYCDIPADCWTSISSAKISGASKVYKYLSDAEVYIGQDFSSLPQANALIMRDENGRAEVESPVGDKDIANKRYVDTTKNYPKFVRLF